MFVMPLRFYDTAKEKFAWVLKEMGAATRMRDKPAIRMAGKLKKFCRVELCTTRLRQNYSVTM